MNEWKILEMLLLKFNCKQLDKRKSNIIRRTTSLSKVTLTVTNWTNKVGVQFLTVDCSCKRKQQPLTLVPICVLYKIYSRCRISTFFFLTIATHNLRVYQSCVCAALRSLWFWFNYRFLTLLHCPHPPSSIFSQQFYSFHRQWPNIFTSFSVFKNTHITNSFALQKGCPSLFLLNSDHFNSTKL